MKLCVRPPPQKKERIFSEAAAPVIGREMLKKVERAVRRGTLRAPESMEHKGNAFQVPGFLFTLRDFPAFAGTKGNALEMAGNGRKSGAGKNKSFSPDFWIFGFPGLLFVFGGVCATTAASFDFARPPMTVWEQRVKERRPERRVASINGKAVFRNRRARADSADKPSSDFSGNLEKSFPLSLKTLFWERTHSAHQLVSSSPEPPPRYLYIP